MGSYAYSAPEILAKKLSPGSDWQLKKVLFGTPSTPTLFRGYLAQKLVLGNLHRFLGYLDPNVVTAGLEAPRLILLHAICI